MTVVAPDTNQSAVGHQKTLMRPLRVRERTLGDGSLAYSVDGSPTDAVSLAFLGYFGHGFDLVAAGINYGANLGDDITYSGTVSAAMEAVINNCPAFAISQEYYAHPDFALAGRAATAVARNILEHGLSAGELINVNVPAVPPDEFDGVEVTRLGQARLPGPADRATGSAGHPLLLDRRAAAVGAGRRRHRLPRRRQPPHRGHADPPRPDRTAPAATPANLGLDAARRTGARGRLRRNRGWTISRSWRHPPGAGTDPAAAVGGLSQAIDGAGGLDGLLAKLRAGGLGDAVDSWESTGPNQPVDPDQLGAALGPDTVSRLSSSSGIDIGQLLPILAAFLPQIIDMLTPDGNVPSSGLDQAAGGMGGLGGLLGGLLGGGAGGAGGAGLDDLLGGLGGMLGPKGG